MRLRRSRFRSVTFLTLGWLFCASVLAASVRPARAEEEDANAARDHYRKALKLFDLLHYREAALEFEAAYQAKSDATFLYNIAQSHRLAGDKDQAIGSYRSYLRREPNAKNAAEVQQRITELQQLIDAERHLQRIEPSGTMRPAVSAPTPIEGSAKPRTTGAATEPARVRPSEPSFPAPSDPTRATPPRAYPDVETPARAEVVRPAAAEASSGPGFTKKIVGGVLLGVGVAAAATGAVFGWQATVARDQADGANPGQTFDPGLEDSFKTNRTLTIALCVGGGVVAAAGAVMMVLGVRESKRPAVAVVPAVSPSGAGVAAFFRF